MNTKVWIRCIHFTFYKSTKDLIIDGEKKNVFLLIKNSVLEKMEKILLIVYNVSSKYENELPETNLFFFFTL